MSRGPQRRSREEDLSARGGCERFSEEVASGGPEEVARGGREQRSLEEVARGGREQRSLESAEVRRGGRERRS